MKPVRRSNLPGYSLAKRLTHRLLLASMGDDSDEFVEADDLVFDKIAEGDAYKRAYLHRSIDCQCASCRWVRQQQTEEPTDDHTHDHA